MSIEGEKAHVGPTPTPSEGGLAAILTLCKKYGLCVKTVIVCREDDTGDDIEIDLLGGAKKEYLVNNQALGVAELGEVFRCATPEYEGELLEREKAMLTEFEAALHARAIDSQEFALGWKVLSRNGIDIGVLKVFPEGRVEEYVRGERCTMECCWELSWDIRDAKRQERRVRGTTSEQLAEEADSIAATLEEFMREAKSFFESKGFVCSSRADTASYLVLQYPKATIRQGYAVRADYLEPNHVRWSIHPLTSYGEVADSTIVFEGEGTISKMPSIQPLLQFESAEEPSSEA